MDIREMVKQNRTQTQDPINEVKKVASNIHTVQETVDTARQLSGVSKIEEHATRQEENAKEERERADGFKDQLHSQEISSLEKNIENRFAQLQQGQSKSVLDTIREAKQASDELGLGKDNGKSKVTDQLTELQVTLELLNAINPQKDLTTQLTEFTAIQALLKPPKEETAVAAQSDGVAIQLRQMQQNHEVAMEQLKDDRQDRQQKFELLLKKYEDDKVFRNNELLQKASSEREKYTMLNGTFDKVGKIVARAMVEEGAGSPRPAAPGGRVQQQSSQAISVSAGMGEAGSFPCAKCGSNVVIAADATGSICSNCQQVYKIIREEEKFVDPAQNEEAVQNEEVQANLE